MLFMCVFFQYVPKESFKYFSIYFQRNLTKFVIKLHERKTTALLCSWFCGVMLAIVCATVKGIVFKQFTLGKAQSKSESLGLEKGNISQETDQLVVWTIGKPRVPLKFDFAGAPRVSLRVLQLGISIL